MLLKRTLQYLPAQFFGPLFQFASMIVWTHWLAPREMGVYALVTVSQEFIYLATLSWFSQYSLRYLPEKSREARRRHFLRTETSIVLIAGLLHLLAAFVLLQLMGGGHSMTLFAAAAGYFVTRTLNVHLSERARADEHAIAYTIAQTAGPVGGLALGLLFMHQWGGGVTAVFAGYAVAQLIGALAMIALLGIALRPARPSPAIMRSAFGYGLPLIGVELLAWGCDHAIRYIVEFELGAAALGLLSVGWGLGLRTGAFAAMLVSAAAFPLASRMINQGRRDEALLQLRLNAALLLGLLLPAVAGLWSIAPEFVGLLVAEPYQAVTLQVLPLALLAGALRQVRFHIFDQLFILDRRFSYGSLVNIVDLSLSVLMIFIGLKLAGLAGAVLGATVAAFAATCFSAALAIRRSGFLFPMDALARIALAAALLALAVRRSPLPDGVAGLATGILIGVSVYAAAIFTLFPQLAGILLTYLTSRRAKAGV